MIWGRLRLKLLTLWDVQILILWPNISKHRIGIGHAMAVVGQQGQRHVSEEPLDFVAEELPARHNQVVIPDVVETAELNVGAVEAPGGVVRRGIELERYRAWVYYARRVPGIT